MFVINNSKNELMLKNSVFVNITISKNITKNLILIIDFIGNIIIYNNNFTNILYFDNILLIDDCNGSINLSYIIFEQDYVFSHLIYVGNTINITFFNINSIFTNNNNNDFYYLLGGGSIKLYNTINRNITYVIISNSFSGKTTFGIIIIDDSYRYYNGLAQVIK